MRTYALSAVLTLTALAAAGPARASVLEPAGTSPGVELERLQVHSTVRGRGAKTVLYLSFRNRGSDQRAQATMVFPVPDGAAVQGLRIKIEDKWMEGEVTGRRQGQAVYDRLYARRVDPALLAQVGDSSCRLRAFPIPSGGTAEVEITWWHMLPEDDGALYWELPLDTDGATASPARTALAVSLDCRGLEAPRVKLPAGWQGARFERADDGVRVVCPERQMPLEGTVRVELKPRRAPELILARRDGRAGHFYLEVRPDAPGRDKAAPRRFVFCLDRSGSMNGEKIKQAREALVGCLNSLRPVDKFNIITFSSDVTAFTEKLEPAAEMHRAALRFIQEIRAGGSTDIRGACLAALQLDRTGEEPLDVILISDGQQTVGLSTAESVLDAVRDGSKGRKCAARLSVVGIGQDVDAALLRKLATTYEGESAFVTAEHAVSGQIESVLAQLQAVRMERVKVSVQGCGAELATQEYHPNVPYGRAIPVGGTYAAAGELKVTVSWTEGTVQRRWAEDFRLPERRDDFGGAPILAANAYVNALEEEIGRTAGEDQRIGMIVTTGRRYRLVSRYTSLIALESEQLYAQEGVARPKRDELGIAREVDSGNVQGEKRFEGIKPAPDEPPDRRRDGVVNPGPLARRQPDPARPATVRTPVVVTETPIMDRFQTDTSADTSIGRGQRDASSDIPLGGTGVSGSIGVGGGGTAGVFGYRDGGGRRRAVGRFGGSPATETAVEAALDWLARHQAAEGCWDPAATGATGKVEGEANGLATLAFLAAGYTTGTGQYRERVRKALAWIVSRQNPDGSFKVEDADAYRTHAVLTLALSEAQGMNGDAALRDAAQKAVDHALRIRKELSGWGRIASAAPDAVTTAWFVAALRSARTAGLKVDGEAFQGAQTLFEKLTVKERTGMTEATAGQSSSTATLAAAVASQFLGTHRGQLIRSVRWATEQGADPRESADQTPERLYFGTLACFNTGGAEWSAWNTSMQKSLLGSQHQDGPRDGSAKDLTGSWAPRKGAEARGRVYATAMGALCLEVYYRYLPVYGR